MSILNRQLKGLIQGILAICVGYFGGFHQLAQAAQLADGSVYFLYPPSLLRARVTQGFSRVSSTYYFTLDIPRDAGEPLKRVTITEQTGLENIKFKLKETQAFLPSQSKQEIPMEQMTVEQHSRTVSVTFATPITPGQTVTVALRSVQNPAQDGIYLFGVTAFPQGEKTHGQFLGFGRLHFYGR